MAIHLVDLLKIIKVDIRQGRTLLATFGSRQRLPDAPQQLAAIGQPGERVVLSQMNHLQRRRTGLADIVEHQHATDHIARTVVDACRGIFHWGIKTVLVAQQAVAAKIDDGVALDRRSQRIGHWLRGIRIEYL